MNAAGHRTVTHFPMLSSSESERLFHRRPRAVAIDGDVDLVSTALGATLYIPAVRDNLADLIVRAGAAGSVSVVIDLEDAVPDEDVQSGVAAIVSTLDALSARPSVPMVFVRVRHPGQIDEVLDAIAADTDTLAGFVLPKFSADTGRSFLDPIVAANTTRPHRLRAMPIIETPRVLHLETRSEELHAIAELLDAYRSVILAVRIGATDLSGAFGIRRDPDLTIYDVHPVASVIASIVNVLGRRDGTGFIITGPVWEYYNAHERMFRPLLRNTPFREIDAVRFRNRLVSRDLDGLLRELVLDRANGLQGKTVIHPTHVNVVHSVCAVSHEEFVDALAVLNISERDLADVGAGGATQSVTDAVDAVGTQAADVGGVLPSEYRNKMNERRPHRNWAIRTLTRATVFGVTRPEVGVIELLTAVVDR